MTTEGKELSYGYPLYVNIWFCLYNKTQKS